ncbi:MAG TPA: exodeoxyribonuclease VII large subunit [Myxococcota bacterium]|nr:exodeoxyribonuclease VII large subunit [Myxococcota bacterium]HPB51239.1 exodeoxyribonuclease VII large subunit [Myxococcota bacterium]HQP96752.1 exodeoxyribonuclease VII large subunit [Myxococcota bacterium]
MELDELLELDGQGGDAERVFSVVQISGRIKTVLEDQFRRVSVEGEVTGLKGAGSGHMYFSLAERDARNVTHKLDCVIYKFVSAARQAGQFKEGDRVVATGRITAWGGASKYQMSVDSIRLAGAGNLLRRLEELRNRLLAEGLFDPSRKRPIPRFPRRIGVVTSVRGAAIRDIVRTIANRWPADILVFDTLVQGDGAAAGVARGIEILNQVPDVDVIIVGRGGGSMEDLWAFNEEVAVRAVAGSAKPVISAVGHEVDHVLTDDAADARAATPTAAGQMVVPSMDDLTAALDDGQFRATRAVVRQLDESGQILDELSGSLLSASRRILVDRLEMIRVTRARLNAAHPARRLADKERHLQTALARLDAAGRRLLERPGARLESVGLRLDALNPAAPLARGYAIATDAAGNVVRSAEEVAAGDQVGVMLGKGSIDCRVVSTRPLPERME